MIKYWRVAMLNWPEISHKNSLARKMCPGHTWFLCYLISNLKNIQILSCRRTNEGGNFSLDENWQFASECGIWERHLIPGQKRYQLKKNSNFKCRNWNPGTFHASRKLECREHAYFFPRLGKCKFKPKFEDTHPRFQGPGWWLTWRLKASSVIKDPHCLL